MMIREILISFASGCTSGIVSVIVCSNYKYVKNITVNKRIINIIKKIEGDNYAYPMLKLEMSINNNKFLEINKFIKYREIYKKIDKLSNIFIPEMYDIELINDLNEINSYILNKNKKNIIKRLISLIEKHNNYSDEIEKFIKSTDNQDELREYIPHTMARLLCEKDDILEYVKKLRMTINRCPINAIFRVKEGVKI